MSQDPVVIYSTPHLQQAYLLLQSLAEVGIEARVETPAIPHHGLFEYSQSTRVVVRRQDSDEARRIATEFDQLLQLPQAEERETPMAEPSPAKTTGEIIQAWPRCPECSTARMAECLVCGGAQDFFSAAYQQEEEVSELHFCGSCDDVAELQYARRCHQCGHDYGDGYEPPMLPRKENESLAWTVLWCMLAGSAGLAGYFYFLVRR